MYIGLYVKYPLFLSDFDQTLFSHDIYKKNSNFMKIRVVGADSFHADGRTEKTTKLRVFAILRTRPKTGRIILFHPTRSSLFRYCVH